MTSYLEEMQHNPALRAFVEAQRGQAAVELAALKVENEHQRAVIESQKQRLAELEPKPGRKKGNA